MQVHLYLMCYRTEALVASHLSAEEFGAYMAVGTQKRTSGNVAFFEIDPTLKSEALNLPEALTRCTPHADGSPRRSKYLSIYRVMENIPLTAYGRLYLTTRDGRVLALEGQEYFDGSHSSTPTNMYVELCPVMPRVVSSLSPSAFCKFITDPKHAIYIPKLFFADTLIDREADGRLAKYLPYRDPEHIQDCLASIGKDSDKLTKTVDRNPPLVAFYRTIRRGFFLGDQTGVRFYPYPSQEELDEKHHPWWRSASMG